MERPAVIDFMVKVAEDDKRDFYKETGKLLEDHETMNDILKTVSNRAD